MSRTKTTPDATQRRGFLRGLGLAAGAAAATATPAMAERSDTVPQGMARKENDAEKKAPRYRETAHVKAFYRTNGF